MALTYEALGEALRYLRPKSWTPPIHEFKGPRHCVERRVLHHYRIFAGGVCHGISEEEACLDEDMVELTIDVIIMEPRRPTDGSGEVFEDLALIQLEDTIPKRDNIDFICLPQSVSTPLPRNLTVHGWGTRVYSDRPSTHLRYTVMSTIAPKAYENKSCPPNHDKPGIPFCAYDAGNWPSHDMKGDSGSGFVQFNATMNQYVLYGALTGGDFYRVDGTMFDVSVVVAIHKYVSDLCYYINLCQTTFNVSQSGWDLGSICLTRPRDFYSNLYPFSNNGYSYDFVEQCFKTTEVYWKHPPSDETVKFTWAAVLLDKRSDGLFDVVCTATLITNQHLVTTRSCIIGWLDANKHRLSNGTWESPNWVLMAGGECYAKGSYCTEVDMVALQIQFLAWQSVAEDYQDLAIIQLKSSINDHPELENRVAPACLETHHERFCLSNLIAYGWAKSDPNNRSHVPSTKMQRTVLKLISSEACRKDSDDFKMSSCEYGVPEKETAVDIGTPAVKMYVYSFASMLTNVTEKSYTFWDVTSFDSAFCTYFNYCPRKDVYLENAISYFDTFLYPG